MSEAKRIAIVDWSGNALLADVVESSTNPWTYGLVIVNADGSEIGNDTTVNTDATLTGNGTSSSPLSVVSTLTTKWDLLTYSTTKARLWVGTDGYVLTADSTQTTWIKWAAAAASWFGEAVLQDYQGPNTIGILWQYQATRAGTLAEVTLTSDAIPVWSNLIAVLYKNSTTTGNVLNATLQVATSDSLTNGKKVVSVTSFTDTAIADGDYFTWYLTSVGSTTPWINAKLVIRYT